MRGVSRGHRELPGSVFGVASWSAGIVDGRVHDAPEFLEEWTQGIDIDVDVIFELLDSRFMEGLGLGHGSKLGVQTLWHSPGTKLRGCSPLVPLSVGEVATSVQIPGHQVRKHIRLEHVVVVIACVNPRDEFAPSSLGSIVWSSEPVTMRLEGIAPRLPVLPRNFSQTYGFEGGHAMWWLNLLSSDFDTDAAAAVWLWVNAENAQVATMLEDPETDKSQLLISLMGVDVARQLVMIALKDEDFDPGSAYANGSLGMVLRNLVNLLGADIADLRTMLREAPTELDARIQARTAGVLM